MIIQQLNHALDILSHQEISLVLVVVDLMMVYGGKLKFQIEDSMKNMDTIYQILLLKQII